MVKKAVAAYETGEADRHVGTRGVTLPVGTSIASEDTTRHLGVFGNEFAFQRRPEAMPLSRSPACPLSRARPEANRPNRDRQPFRAARKVRRRVAESAAQSGSGRSARPTSVRVLMVFSRSRLDGVLPFFPVVQSAVLICRLWCVSLPYPQLDTNLMPKRGSTPLPETSVSGATRVSSRNPHRDFGRRADRRADQAGYEDGQPRQTAGEKTKSAPDSV